MPNIGPWLARSLGLVGPFLAWPVMTVMSIVPYQAPRRV